MIGNWKEEGREEYAPFNYTFLEKSQHPAKKIDSNSEL